MVNHIRKPSKFVFRIRLFHFALLLLPLSFRKVFILFYIWTERILKKIMLCIPYFFIALHYIFIILYIYIYIYSNFKYFKIYLISGEYFIASVYVCWEEEWVGGGGLLMAIEFDTKSLIRRPLSTCEWELVLCRLAFTLNFSVIVHVATSLYTTCDTNY